MTEVYSRSPGDRRAWLALARSTAVALGVAIDHDSRLPASHQHQLVLAAALGQPAGREGVPELMGVHGRQPSRPSPVMDHMVDAGRGHGPVAADPQVRPVGQPISRLRARK
jgi:hypothetical protein